MSVKDGSCFEETTTTPATTTTTGSHDKEVECDFEYSNFCNWKNVEEEGATMKWILDSGHVADHTTGTVYGQFISADFNSSVQASANFRLSVPLQVKDDSGHCLQFYYKVDSAIWTSLELYLQTEDQIARGEEIPHWVGAGALGNDWILGQYEVSKETELVDKEYYAMFRTTKSEVVKGRVSGWGIVYIDDITYSTGSCPTVGVCTFENTDLCNWHSETHDSFEWLRWRPDYGGVGPVHDHSYHSGPGHYMNLNDKDIGDNEVKSSLLISPVVKQHDQDKCLKFYFEPIDDLPNTYSLKVFTRYPGQDISNKNPLFSIKQTIYDEWMPVLVPLAQSDQDYEVFNYLLKILSYFVLPRL